MNKFQVNKKEINFKYFIQIKIDSNSNNKELKFEDLKIICKEYDDWSKNYKEWKKSLEKTNLMKSQYLEQVCKFSI